MKSKMKFLISIFIMLACIVPSQITHAVGWGEETVVFQNKTTKEFKKTYKMLYRFDDEEFRDSLSAYVKDKPIPNDSLLQNWSVIYYKFCDRQDCKTHGVIDSSMDYHSLKDMSSSDLTAKELETINQKGRSLHAKSIFIKSIFIIFMIVIIYYKVIMGFIIIIILAIYYYKKSRSRNKAPINNQGSQQ